jgi:hypothetical protein
VKAQGATERIKDDMYSRALDKVFFLRFAILLQDREKYRGDSGMSECSVGKHFSLWLVQAWQSDANRQIKILAEQQQRTRRTNHFTSHSVNAFCLQRLLQMSQQLVIGLGPIKTVTEKNNFAIYRNNNGSSETVNKTLKATKYILSGTTSEMSRTRPLPDIQRLDNRLRITMSQN